MVGRRHEAETAVVLRAAQQGHEGLAPVFGHGHDGVDQRRADALALAVRPDPDRTESERRASVRAHGPAGADDVAHDLAVDLGHQGQSVDPALVLAQLVEQAGLHRFVGPVRDREGGRLDRPGRGDVPRTLPAHDHDGSSPSSTDRSTSVSGDGTPFVRWT